MQGIHTSHLLVCMVSTAYIIVKHASRTPVVATEDRAIKQRKISSCKCSFRRRQ